MVIGKQLVILQTSFLIKKMSYVFLQACHLVKNFNSVVLQTSKSG
jgi:hypothetical protein